LVVENFLRLFPPQQVSSRSADDSIAIFVYGIEVLCRIVRELGHAEIQLNVDRKFSQTNFYEGYIALTNTSIEFQVCSDDSLGFTDRDPLIYLDTGASKGLSYLKEDFESLDGDWVKTGFGTASGLSFSKAKTGMMMVPHLGVSIPGVYAPEFKKRLISISQLTAQKQKKVSLKFFENQVFIFVDSVLTFSTNCYNGMYAMNREEVLVFDMSHDI
jgi:hypothetical protein